MSPKQRTWTRRAVLSGIALAGGAAAVAGVNRVRFRRRVSREARRLWSAAAARPTLDPSSLDSLPEAVRRFAARVLPPDLRAVGSARLRHRGVFRTALDGSWLPARGEEYFTADPPAFVWWGHVSMLPGVWFDALDRSSDGVGSMHVEAESTFTIIDATGPEIDQGALIRLLGEMVWLPSALFDGRYVTWAALDERSARATLTVGGHEASCTFTFDADGLPVSVSAERYRDTPEGAVLNPWSVVNEDFRDVNGFLVPHRSIVSWHVDGQQLPYADFLIEGIDYDVQDTF